MAWVVLSSSSLLDNQSGSAPYPQAKLESFVRDCGYKPVTLHNIMRNSSNISTATSLDNVEKYRARAYSPKSISSGFSSTVMGTRPTCYVYEYRMHFDATYDVNYEVVATCIKHYLENCKTACAKTVILCDREISPWQVKQRLAVDVTLYDAGVYKIKKNPHYYSADLLRHFFDLVTWINRGGVLLTHDEMFNGCEAEQVIFLTQQWGTRAGEHQVRSGPTRAVSQLCVVTSDQYIKQEELKQYYNIIEVRADQGRSQKRILLKRYGTTIMGVNL